MRKSMSQNKPPLLTRHFSAVTLDQSAELAKATAELVIAWLSQPSMQTHGVRVWLRGGLGAGKINAPGGKLEAGETALAAAIRETQEEIGVTPLALEDRVRDPVLELVPPRQQRAACRRTSRADMKVGEANALGVQPI